MKIVDIRTRNNVSSIYHGFPQPMYVYDTPEEFYANVKDYDLVSSYSELVDWLSKHREDWFSQGSVVQHDLRNYNLWIKTPDKYIVEELNSYNCPIYRLDDKGNKIPTEGSFIRIFFIRSRLTTLILYTSAGMFNVNYLKWEVTGGVKNQFINDIKSIRHSENVKQNNLRILQLRKKPTLQMMKFVFSVFTPTSEYFLDIEKAFKAHLSRSYPKDSIKAIIQSRIFKETLIVMMRTFYPKLSESIRKQFDPERAAQLLEEMYKTATSAEDAKEKFEMLKSLFGLIADYGYEEEVVSSVNPPQLIHHVFPDSLPEPEGLMKLPEPNSENNPLIDEEYIDRVRKELNYPDSYISNDIDIGSYGEPESENGRSEGNS